MSTSPIEMLERAAQILEPLSHQFVFLGGATVALHLDDPTSPGIRVTKDLPPGSGGYGRAEYIVDALGALSQRLD